MALHPPRFFSLLKESFSATPADKDIAAYDSAIGKWTNKTAAQVGLAPLVSPAFTGTPTAPTAAPGTNTGQISTTAFTQAAIAALVSSSPAALDTLNELAQALGNDASFATTVTNSLAGKQSLSAVLTAVAAISAAANMIQGVGSGVWVVHTDGTSTIYKPAADTNAARGTVIQSAKAAAVSGETIVVGPGTYDTRDLLKNGVHWWFVAGAIISSTTTTLSVGIFDDSSAGANAAIACSIGGFGEFVQAGRGGVFEITNASTALVVNCKKIFQNPVAGGYYAIHQSAGSLNLSCRELISGTSGDAPVWWANGPMFIDAGRIEALNTGISYCVYFEVNKTNAPTGQAYVRAAEIKTNTASIVAVYAATIGSGSNGTSYRMWVDALQIVCAGSDNQAVRNDSDGFLYVHAQKILGRLNLSAGSTYIRADKISAKSSGSLADISGGTNWIDIQQWDDSAQSGANVSISGGTTYFDCQTFIKGSANTGNQIACSGGTIHIRTGLFDVSAGNAAVKSFAQSSTGTINVNSAVTFDRTKTSGTITYPAGASGSFTAGANTVTVVGGLITSIV